MFQIVCSDLSRLIPALLPTETVVLICVGAVSAFTFVCAIAATLSDIERDRQVARARLASRARRTIMRERYL